MEWSPGASFPHFSAMRNGVARRRNVLVQTLVPAAAGNPPAFLRIRRSPVLFVSLSRRLRRASFFGGKERGERNRLRGPISRRSPLESLPDDQGGSAPIGFPTFGRGTRVLRRTRDERLLRVSLSEIKCAMHVHASCDRIVRLL